MKVFMAEYTLDIGATMHTIIINAEDKPKAILDAYIALPFGAIVTDIFEVV